MGFFDRLYYGKAGKRDYSEMDMPKTRVSLFFLVLKDHFFDLIKVNFLQLVFWIPFLLWTYLNLIAIQSIDVDTVLAMENGAQELVGRISSYLVMWLLGLIPCVAITGPSSAGAAYIMRNWARDQHAFLFSDYKDAFKSNWKAALAVSSFTAFLPVLAYTAIAYYGQLAASSMMMVAPLIVVFSATLMWTLMLPLIYPMMIGYELRFKHLIKNAFLMAAARLPQMALARLITAIPVAVLLIGLYLGNGVTVLIVSLYYLLFGFAFSRLVYASFANGIFDKYLNPHIEGAQVNQGLRPKSEEDELFADDEEDDEDEEEIGDDEDED
ncbi:MAG: YesL family protein [Clostridia bacterium]|nr:YesL family protein [Clostridia bacterium]MBQ7052765.1 YesL family protein [Clostridia bacterium]